MYVQQQKYRIIENSNILHIKLLLIAGKHQVS